MSEHLYFHIPFCLKKCRYCDFYSETDFSGIPGFVSALIREIELRSADGLSGKGSSVKTVYFGGGTPSVLPPAAFERILNTISRHYPLGMSAEITLEANPGTLDLEYLKSLVRLGINRLSLGVQSFSDKRLALLGRIHTGKEAVDAIEGARAAGFNNLGLDLIYGLPGETEPVWQEEMDKAISFSPEHLSCYMLTLEPDTSLYRACVAGQFVPMDGTVQVDRFSFTSNYLSRAGYCHYEISNFAQSREVESRHNSAYWKMSPYLGFGPSAHSYTVQGRPGGRDEHFRSWNVSDLNSYMAALAKDERPVADLERLTPQQQMLERVLVGLRTGAGIDILGFDRLPGADFDRDFRVLADRLVQGGMGRFSDSKNFFFLTRTGWAHLDSIVETFAADIPGDNV